MVNKRKSMQKLLNDLHDFFQEAHTVLAQIENLETPDEELADVGFLSRELAQLADNLRKNFKEKQRHAGKTLGERMVDRRMKDPNSPDRIRGQLCVAVPKLEMECNPPKPGSEEYKTLLEKFGISKQVIESGVLKADFAGLKQMATEMGLSGKDVPYLKKWPVWDCTYIRKDE